VALGIELKPIDLAGCMAESILIRCAACGAESELIDVPSQAESQPFMDRGSPCPVLICVKQRAFLPQALANP
jgi:hypothetical protein